jgi:hypothetical protein
LGCRLSNGLPELIQDRSHIFRKGVDVLIYGFKVPFGCIQRNDLLISLQEGCFGSAGTSWSGRNGI